MTDDEAIPESVRRWIPEANDDREENPWAAKYLAAVPLLIGKHDALVAEVRRLRGELGEWQRGERLGPEHAHWGARSK